MQRIILASQSPRRSELLKNIQVSFEVMPSYADESFDEETSASDIAMEIAMRKATDIAKNIKDEAIVIGADTIVYLDKILGKPKNEEDALQMLMHLSGKWHQVLTGIAIVHTESGKVYTDVVVTNVKMRPFSKEKALSYIATKEPMDKAGAYGIQGIGSLLVEKLDGCYFNVVGLPLAKLSEMLEELGVNLL